MPTYDYRCRDCGHVLEIMHSILDDGPEACERCRGPLVRVLHPAGVIFRGSGFYVTDSRSSGKAGSSGSDSGSAESTTPKPEKNVDRSDRTAPKGTDGTD